MGRPRKNAAGNITPLKWEDVAEITVEEQPYPLPEGWKWVRLGDITKIIGGGTPSSKVKEYYENGDIPWLSPADLSDYREIYISHGKKMLTSEGIKNSSARMMPAETVCLSSRAPIGYVAIAKNPLCTNQGFKSFLPSPLYIPKFLYWYLKGSKPLLESYASGTTFLELSGSKAARIEFPLPPLDEQRRIVDSIESLFAKLAEAKEQAEAILDGFETRKAAILHKAFTGELTEKWREANGLTLADWEDLTLNDVAEYRKGPFGSSITKSMFVPKGKDTFKVYEQGNAIQKTLSYGNYYISKEKFNELSSFSVRAGDIIISCAGTIGEIYKLPEGCENGIINQALMRVRVYRNINEKFFEYYFSGVIKRDVIGKANGTAIQNIPPFKVMKAMPICLPPLYEQAEIIRLLDELLSKEQQTKAMAEAVLNQIELMKKTILAKAFHGEL